jgi:hypothetical protein
MAVFNDYVNSTLRTEGEGNRVSALRGGGCGMVKEWLIPFDTVAADDAGSIYRVIKAIPSTAVPLEITIWTDGVTGMNDVDVCLYQVGAGGAEVGTEVLASTIDLSSAVTRATGFNNGMGNITLANYGKPLWELAAETITDRYTHYDIGLKSVADLSEADQIVVYARFAFD